MPRVSHKRLVITTYNSWEQECFGDSVLSVLEMSSLGRRMLLWYTKLLKQHTVPYICLKIT